MRINVNCRHTSELQKLFAEIGADGRFVGGCVRDTLAYALGYSSTPDVKDFDIATPAKPDVVMQVAERLGYRVIPTGLQHGTVTVVIDNEPYEITTLRADVETDGRHAVVEFVTDYYTDAARRDFTFNALSVGLFDHELHDYFDGVKDLKEKRVRFVGDATSRITEDFLRILRFFRFRQRYGGNETNSDFQTIGRLSTGLAHISGERIWSEISRIFTNKGNIDQVLKMMDLDIFKHCGLETRENQALLSILSSASEKLAAPSVVLGALINGPSALEAAFARLKISSLDMKYATETQEVLKILTDVTSPDWHHRMDSHYWTCRLIDGASPYVVQTVLTALDYRHVWEGVPQDLPTFPVRGADLIERGVKAGKEMGALLKTMKDQWKAANFTLDKDALLRLHNLNEMEVSYRI